MTPPRPTPHSLQCPSDFSQFLCYFLKSIILSLPVSPQWIMCGKTKQPYARPFQDTSKYTDFLAKASEVNLRWVYLRIGIRVIERKYIVSLLFKTAFAFAISCVTQGAFILVSSKLGFNDAVQQGLHNESQTGIQSQGTGSADHQNGPGKNSLCICLNHVAH